MQKNPTGAARPGMPYAVPPHVVTTCMGAQSQKCPFRPELPEGFAAAVEETVAASGWPEFQRERLGQGIRHHQMFQITIAGCANGCSRPHITDVGLVASVALAFDPARCTGCAACVASCPDQAIELAVADG